MPVRCRKPLAYLAVIALFAVSTRVGISAKQQTTGANSDGTFDPLRQVTTVFPDSVKLNQTKRILEFCPDYDTCDALAASSAVSVATLKDVAYLYIYFFSNFFDLAKWRNRPESQATAERVLSKPEYRKCKRDTDFESARCVLLDLAQKSAIRLEFIRYDEGARNVVREDLAKELIEKTPPSMH
jgi:hypothetical protein